MTRPPTPNDDSRGAQDSERALATDDRPEAQPSDAAATLTRADVVDLCSRAGFFDATVRAVESALDHDDADTNTTE